MFAALAEGTSRVRGLLRGRDVLATLACMVRLGLVVEDRGAELLLHGSGSLREAEDLLDCANSGTTMRLLAGLLVGQRCFGVLTGSAQLRTRPMARIVEPLRAMGAVLSGRGGGGLAPLVIHGAAGKLRGQEHRLAIASAQVKSAILLAGLGAPDPTVIIEPGPARDHTERLLAAMGVGLEIDGPRITMQPPEGPLTPLDVDIPADPSSAAFLAVAASIVPGSEILLTGVSTNPTRFGLFEVLREMGADIREESPRIQGGEPVADLRVCSAPLQGIELGGARIVTLIDELPVLAVAAACAEGRTVVGDAGELRVKESDRIKSSVTELSKLGVAIEERADGFEIQGGAALRGAAVTAQGDHRLAMALAIAGLVAEGRTSISGAETIPDSYPGFEAGLVELGAALEAS